MHRSALHREAADALLDAARTRTPIEPLSATYADIDIDDAYEIQSLQVEHWRTAGRTVCGYKVGLTSEPMQQQLGVDQPDFGVLLEDVRYASGATVPHEQFIAPRIEPEFGFILTQSLRGPGLTAADVLPALGAVVPALEIIDSRVAEWRITITDTIADNASFGAVVLGTPVTGVTASELETSSVTMTVGGRPAGSGLGSAVLGSPVNAIVWLANTLGERGVELPAGAVVLPGSVCAAAAVAPGERVVADFGALGAVEITLGGNA